MIARRFRTSIVIPCLLAIWAPGCLEHEVKTTIHADGTGERTITLNPESKQLPKTCFPLPTDRGWDTSWTKTGDAKYLVTFTKKFKDLEQLSHETCAYKSLSAGSTRTTTTPSRMDDLPTIRSSIHARSLRKTKFTASRTLIAARP
jgi:hypothetical protein